MPDEQSITLGNRVPPNERQACEIRIRAERRAGELLRDMEKAKGAQGNPGGRGAPIVQSSDATAQPKTLSDLGISKQQSSNWQRLAAVPEETFDDELKTHRIK